MLRANIRRGSRILRGAAIAEALVLIACAAQAPTAATPIGPDRASTVTAAPSAAPTVPIPTVAPTPMPKRVGLVVASVSMRAMPDKLANLRRFEEFMSEAAEEGARLIVFPEDALQQNPGWGTQSDFPTREEIDYVARTAEPVPGEITARIQARARQLGLYVVFGMTERAPDGLLYNASVLVGPEGYLGSYRKNTLWDSASGGNEHKFWARGDEAGKVIDTRIGKIGLMTCIEMAFNYGAKLAAKGAELLVTVSGWPAISGSAYDMYSAKNATACQCWHVVSDQVGEVGYGSMYGHSVVIDPAGVVITGTGAVEGMVIAETSHMIDLSSLPAR